MEKSAVEDDKYLRIATTVIGLFEVFVICLCVIINMNENWEALTIALYIKLSSSFVLIYGAMRVLPN